MILRLLSYPRSLLFTMLYPLYLVFMSALCVGQNLVFNRRKFDDLVISWWAKGSCRMFGVRVKVVGLENFPPGGCVCVFNHTSFFDIFSMSGYLPSIRFGAKIELFKIPFFGLAMRRVGVLPIARERRDEVFKLYQESQERIMRGERFALAPEGTRQTSAGLGRFKSGPFVFAINAKAPVVPVVIKNAAQILPKHHLFPNWGIWSQEIILQILPPIDAAKYKIEDRPLLQKQVYEIMEKSLATNE